MVINSLKDIQREQKDFDYDERRQTVFKALEQNNWPINDQTSLKEEEIVSDTKFLVADQLRR